ncbi:MAG: hypothetical protein CK533_08985 [Acidobacterium sp.]|nr:hypothetical protein [Acidobacteriota bacterium]PHY10596.1 MAG: hypothetical protein CK533_08985 [Acidobacterium sp.]
MELVNACLGRIDVYNPKVNAFITVMREAALAQARTLDEEQRAGKLRGPLHGIPIALKDNIDTAGAIVVGKANLHEFAFGGIPRTARLRLTASAFSWKRGTKNNVSVVANLPPDRIKPS